MNLDGPPGHIPDRREAILGGCGENVLFSTLRRMTRGSVLLKTGDERVEQLVCTLQNPVLRSSARLANQQHAYVL
jgi:hypothetical protein